MKYYPREIIDCYIDDNYEQLLNIPNASSVYIASVAKDLKKNLFYIERGFSTKDDGFMFSKVLPDDLEDLNNCIEKYRSKKGITSITESFVDDNKTPPLEDKGVEEFELQVTGKQIRPVSGGCCIGHEFSPSYGTLGAALYLKNIDRKYIISNYHVLCNKKFKKNNLIFQPAPVLSGKIDYKNVIAKLKFGHFGDYVDVAFAEVVYEDEIETGTIWNNDPINGLGIPRIGEKVTKSGITTHTTDGTIRSTNTYVKFKNPWRKNEKKVILKKQILTCNMSDNGDSGSLLLNKNREAVGLLVGGDKHNFSIYNNLKYIFNQKYPSMKNLEFNKFV